MRNGQQNYFIVYAIWTIAVFILVFIKGGVDSAGLASILAILLLGAQLLFIAPIRAFAARLSSWAGFVLSGLFCSSIVEGFHMIHEPVFKALKIVPAMSVKSMAACYGLDLLFTLPVYLAIFSTIWLFISRYRYTLWQYFIVFSMAQAMGDGGVFFFSSKPFLLLFLPYTLVNYHAMNVLPFLLAQRSIEPLITGWQKYVVAPGAVIAVYLAGGALIKAVGSLFSFS